MPLPAKCWDYKSEPLVYNRLDGINLGRVGTSEDQTQSLMHVRHIRYNPEVSLCMTLEDSMQTFQAALTPSGPHVSTFCFLCTDVLPAGPQCDSD